MYIFFLPQILQIVLLLIMLIIKISIPKFPEKHYELGYVQKSYTEKTWLDRISYIYMGFVKFCTVIMFSFVFGITIYKLQYLEIIKIIRVLAKDLQREFLTCFGIVLTLSVVLVAFKKEYYLVFNYREVLSIYGFYRKFLICGVIFLLSKNISIVQKICVDKEEIKFACDFINAVLGIWGYILLIILFYIVVKLVFSKEQDELKILNNLYFKCEQRIGQIRLSNKEVSDMALMINTEYLLNQYFKTTKKIEKIKAKKFELSSVYGKNEKNIYKQIVNFLKLFLLMWGIFTEIIWITISMLLKYSDCKAWIWGILIALANVCSYLSMKCIGMIEEKSVFRCLLNRFFLHDFVITYETEKREKMLSVEGFWPFNKNSHFIKAILNEIIFYKILNESKVKMKRVMKQIEELYVYYEEREKIDNNWFYIIIIYYSFFYYWKLNKKERKKFVEEINGKAWIKQLENEKMISLIIIIIRYTEKSEKIDEGIRIFECFKDEVTKERKYKGGYCE